MTQQQEDLLSDDPETEEQEAEMEASTTAQQLAAFDPLEDLYTDAILAQQTKRKRVADPSLREALASTAKKMKDLFNLPENWERTRGLAIIDKDTKTLIGNFSEYRHRTVAGCRKLLREHSPIAISGTEEVSGWLGESLALRKGEWGMWHDRREVELDLMFPELMVGHPQIRLSVAIYLNGISRADLLSETQFAAASGNIVITLPAGTNVYEAMGTDGRLKLRKLLGLDG